MTLRYGADYNPEQWPEEVWADDITLMRRAGVNLVSLGIFSWSQLQPAPERWDFGWLDRIVEQLHRGGIGIDLATATASPPPWLTLRHPEVLPVTADGVRLGPGSRQHYCPSSPVYRQLAARLVTRLVDRYGQHPAVEMWHVGNEFGNHVSRCYCEVSADAFRLWLRRRYGTIDAVNEAWATTFWSQRYGDFAEIMPPAAMPTFPNPGQLVDFDRFTSDELLECYQVEARIIRAATPTIPVTTNFMGFFQSADYWSWAPHMDVIADDSYPDPLDPESPIRAAMQRDLVRSLGGGRSWLLMEQSTSAVNWRERNAPKLSGRFRAWSYQAIARGADGVLQFQWRQSRAGAERFHSAMVPHGGTGTRVWREVEQLGQELRLLHRVERTTVPARVAIVFDWASWWSLDQPALPTQVDYVETHFQWYRELFRRNITVEFVSPDDDVDRFDLVIVPTLFAASTTQLESLGAYIRGGGTLLASYLTGTLDERGHVHLGQYLGPLADALEIRIEEFAPLDDAATIAVTRQATAVEGAGTLWAEFLTTAGAEARWTFTGGELDGLPAVTAAKHGAGTGWYVATQPDEATLSAILGDVLAGTGVRGALPSPVTDVEAVQRGDVLFVINHSDRTATVPIAGHDLLTGTDVAGLQLSPRGVAAVEQARPIHPSADTQGEP